MASSRKKGNASITYTALGAGAPTTFVLAVPILVAPDREFATRRKRRRWSAFNSDGSDRETFIFGNVTDEIVGQIRYDDQPNQLLDLLSEALENDVVLTYTPDGVTDFPCLLVEIVGAPADAIEIVPDPQRFGHGEWSATVRLRRVDGGTFDAIRGPDA